VTLAANGGGTDWTAGWTVSVGGAAIKTWEALEGNPQVTTTPVTGSITFSGQEETAQAVSFEMTQTNSTTNQTRCIRVSRVGLIGFERNACP
jgi:hypothetical protein